ncbi:acyltransferase family protein [Terriglobus saanensis]|nr:acyltransferase [Terriglobus saanensis]
MNRTPAYLQTKSHYEILDGLRGVAALMVVMFHTFEAYADGNRFKQIMNHGYLAVDFFFLLSGFVVAYAYDDRWGKMTQWDFYKRRLVRLQPMVIMGNVIGAALFYFQACPIFSLVSTTPVHKMLLVMLVGFTMLPLLPSMDIRGWQEMHPLDGPAWSLFFEYIANILYGIGFRKLSNKALGVFVALSAALLIHLTVFGTQGDVIGGWAVDKTQMHIGFARMLYPFFAGILLMRLGKRIHVPNAFTWCSLMIVVIFCLPRFGGPQHLWRNGLYESFCIIVLFPIVVAMGAGDRISGPLATKLCKFFGEISYPLYITHYPLIYVYTAWVTRNKIPAAQGAVWGVALLLTAVTIAYACLKLYDEPVREWLRRRFLVKSALDS